MTGDLDLCGQLVSRREGIMGSQPYANLEDCIFATSAACIMTSPKTLGEHGYQRYGDSASVYRPGKVG